MAQQTSQIGEAQIGALWIGAADAAAPTPPFDPSTQPWNVIVNSGEPPQWRRRTLDSFVAYTVLPQPPVDPSTIASPVTVSDFNQRLTPPWRFRTQDSFLTVTFPAFISSKQINFVGQGVNHRRLGTPTLTGGSQGFHVFIRSVDRSGTYEGLSGKFTRQIQTMGTCEVHFNVPFGGFQPSVFDRITLIESNRTIFDGWIDTLQTRVYPATREFNYVCKGTDWTGTLQRRLVTKSYPGGQTLLSIVQDIVLIFLNLEGYDITTFVDTSVIVNDPQNFTYNKVSDAFNQLALATDTIWWVDNFKRIHFQLVANVQASAYSITDTGPKQVDADAGMGIPYIEQSAANYRNKQYIKASQNVLNSAVTITDNYTFSGNPGDFGAPTSYPLTTSPNSVKVNGSEIVGTASFFELLPTGTVYPPNPPGGYYWIKDGFGVFHWPSNVGNEPTAGTTIAIQYTGVSTYVTNVVVYSDTAQQAAVAAAMGGQGIFEEVENFSGTATYSQLLALAQGTEQATAPIPNTVYASTIEKIEDVGYSVLFNRSDYGLNETLVIQKLDAVCLAADLGKGSSWRYTLQMVSKKTLGNFPAWFEGLLRRLNQLATITPTEKPTWNLAMDEPGNPSTGLAPGLVGAAYPVQVNQGRINYVSAVFQTQSDANIVIDITKNGQSIFDSNKLSYPALTQGVVELYVNLSPFQINVKQNDQLLLNVLSTGAVQPGKNGTVIVVIGSVS